ncbi:MAG: AMP-binding protein [Pseudomonadota bacterium]|nr:AMP-binding protein [Pseudomonadota bacterium]
MIWPLGTLLASRIENGPVAMRRGKAIDFATFRSDVARVAAELKNCGRGALACQDSYNFIVGFFGLLHAGSRIVVPPHAKVAATESSGGAFDRLIDDAAIEGGGRGAATLDPLDPTWLAFDFYTSGSSGAPKRVTKSLAMFDAEIEVLEHLWGPSAGPVFATVTHQHVYGLTFKLLWAIAAGRPFTTVTYPLWEDMLPELTAGSVIISSPAHLGRLEGIKALPIAQRPQRIFSAGATLPPEAARQAAFVFGTRPTEIFGSTETGAIATRRGGEEELWQPLPGTRVRSDEQGRLLVLSPHIGPDWVTTSDLVDDLDGRFRFRGRSDRIVKVEGKRVSLVDVEQALERLDEVQSAFAGLLPGEVERLVAVIVPSELGRLTLIKIGKFRFGRLLRQALAVTEEPANIPRLWRYVDELPVSSLGKRRNADILSLFREDA